MRNIIYSYINPWYVYPDTPFYGRLIDFAMVLLFSSVMLFVLSSLAMILKFIFLPLAFVVQTINVILFFSCITKATYLTLKKNERISNNIVE